MKIPVKSYIRSSPNLKFAVSARPQFKPVSKLPPEALPLRTAKMNPPGPGWIYGQRESGVTLYDGDYAAGGKTFRQSQVLMDPKDFLKWQWEKIVKPGNSGIITYPETSFKDWLNSADNDRVLQIANAIEDNHSRVPAPIAVAENGRLTKINFQEGRHRALAAIKLGQALPVLLVEREFGDRHSYG